MKFMIDAAVLAGAVQTIAKMIPSRPIHEVLVNLVIKADADKNMVTVFGYDGAMSIEITLSDATVQKNGVVVTGAKLLSEVISQLSGEITFIVLDTYMIQLRTDRGKYDVRGSSTEEYDKVTLPSPEKDGVKLDLPIETLIDGFKTTVGFCNPNHHTPALTGIRLSRVNERIEFAATDSHQVMIFRPEELDAEIEGVTIPGKAVAEILKILEKTKTETATLWIDKVQVVINVPGYQIMTRLIDQPYPPYRLIVPNRKDFAGSFYVERKELLDTVRRVKTVAKENKKLSDLVTLRLDFDNNLVYVQTKAEVAQCIEAIPIQISDSPPDAFSLDSNFLIDGLKIMKTTEVGFHLVAQDKPILIEPLGGKDIKHIIIPLSRVNL